MFLFFGHVEANHTNTKATHYLSSQKNLLTDKQLRILDAYTVKALPECSFLYSKAPIGTVTGDVIYQCIEAASSWFWSTGYKA